MRLYHNAQKVKFSINEVFQVSSVNVTESAGNYGFGQINT